MPEDAKATKRPSGEIADCVLAPFAGVVPSLLEMSCTVWTQPEAAVTHVDVSKTSEYRLGFELGDGRFVAAEEKETNSPVFAIAGSELGPSAGVEPSGVETKYVVGTHDEVCVNGVTPEQIVRM
jgi:hypothetical protein